MEIVVDIGNTSAKLYLFENEKIIRDGKFEEIIDDVITSPGINGITVVSVVPERTSELRNILRQRSGIEPLVIEHDHYRGLKSRYANIYELGIDRLCNIAYSVRYHKNSVIVIDLGSAVTFEVIGKDGEFEGGMILPGIRMQSNALLKNTSLLPGVVPEYQDILIGRSTKECIRSGILNGIVSVCEGFVKKISDELGGKFTVVISGGDAGIISRSVNFDHIVEKFTVPLGAIAIKAGRDRK